MSSTLEYATRQSNVRSLAIPALICGAISGPAAFALALLAGQNHLDEQTKEFLGLSALIGVLGGAFTFSCVVRVRLPKAASPRTRAIANLAIIAPLLWAAAIFAFFVYLLSQAGT